MKRRQWHTLVRVSATTLSVLLLLLYIANLPFYSGSSLGPDYGWRMEHGRLKFQRNDGLNHESFYIAGNSEGLRFKPEWRRYTATHWMVNIPLWMPLGAVMLIAGWSWRRWRRDRRQRNVGYCPKCGYDMSGLKPGGRVCPECGYS